MPLKRRWITLTEQIIGSALGAASLPAAQLRQPAPGDDCGQYAGRNFSAGCGELHGS